MSKWDQFRATAERAHAEFEFPEATFENWGGATYNPDTGQMEGGEWTDIGTAEVEFVPPSVDSTVSTEGGTDLAFDTSLRLPDDDLEALDEDVVPYGEDAEKPTRVTVQGTTYEVQSNAPEHGSGMILLRVAEV